MDKLIQNRSDLQGYYVLRHSSVPTWANQKEVIVLSYSFRKI